jgi:phasin family protein
VADSKKPARRGRVAKAILTEMAPAAITPSQMVPLSAAAAEAPAELPPFVEPAQPAAMIDLEFTPQTDDVSAIALEAAEIPVQASVEAAVHAAEIEVAPAAAQPLQPSNTINTQGAKTMTDAINNTINQTREATQQATTQAAEQFRTVAAQTTEQSKAAMEKSARIVEEMADLGRGNIEAMVASSKTAAKYVETLTQGAADYNRRSFEQASATLRSFAEVKSPTDMFRLQSDFARSAFDQMVAESARVSETMVKMTGDVVEPITSRYSVAAERLKTVAA